ncbi:MAG: EamA family transporter [Actinobacteria bacterium]|nr:EamA family transporter [Actinomycetota bacterium]
MGIVLGLAAAMIYGAADFVGGLVSRRTNVLAVVLLSQLWGTAPLLLAVPFFGTALAGEDLAWGSAAGLAGAAGIVFLYRGLSIGRMTVVAPTTAVEAATFPVIFGLAGGERPSAVALTGVALALAAVALVSSSPRGAPGGIAGQAGPGGRLPPGLLEALAAGLAFGFFFISLERTSPESGLLPLVVARATAMVSVGLAALLTRRSLRPSPGTSSSIATAGGLDVLANILYLLASRQGLLSLVAVLTSLYPASTVLLARVVLRERLWRVQAAGLILAAVGVALIALG